VCSRGSWFHSKVAPKLPRSSSGRGAGHRRSANTVLVLAVRRGEAVSDTQAYLDGVAATLRQVGLSAQTGVVIEEPSAAIVEVEPTSPRAPSAVWSAANRARLRDFANESLVHHHQQAIEFARSAVTMWLRLVDPVPPREPVERALSAGHRVTRAQRRDREYASSCGRAAHNSGLCVTVSPHRLRRSLLTWLRKQGCCRHFATPVGYRRVARHGLQAGSACSTERLSSHSADKRSS
jgi:hypothetical protein